MADQISPQQFEQRQVLESDVTKVAGEVQRHKEMPEHKETPDRDLVRKSIQVLTTTTPTANAGAAGAGYLPAYAADLSPEMKLEAEHLIDLAFSEGLEKATAEAKKGGPFMVDILHDVLTGKLYDELKKRHLVE